jgi:hypothetical protein
MNGTVLIATEFHGLLRSRGFVSSEKPSGVGRLSCNLNFNEAKHEMCVIIQGEDDIYPDGIAITYASLNRARSTVGSGLASLLGHDYGHGHPIEAIHRIA